MPARPPIHLRRHRHAQSEAERQRQQSPAGAKIWIGEGGEGHRRVDTPTSGRLQTVDDEATPRHFAVVNVGAGGVLYLKPSRMGPANSVNHAPATPPATILERDPFYAEPPSQRASYVSGTWTPRGERGRSLAKPEDLEPQQQQQLVLVPLPDEPRRTRSHSCSTRGTIYNPNDLHHLAPTTEEKRRRRRSSTDLLPSRLLDLQIPHYRLGTPRFSDRGTAYLHASIYTVSTVDGVPSSILSREEYENLFPVPPGHTSGHPSIYMNPSRPYTMSIASGVRQSALTSVRSSVAGAISAKMFEKLEKNLNDPAVVRHHPTNGKIVAATPARLIAQITSPDFLDYELLADFFLTFRCFMTCQDVLEYLFARMRWAFGDGNDAGRIARVRTFVALRHWILNYFLDDFIKDDLFRQSFCDMVNELATSLRERPDRGNADINIVGELKKCWRRTCALYWPVADALESDPDADIVPGGHPQVAPSAQSSDISLPLTIRPTNERGSIFELTTIDLPDMYEAQFGALNGAMNDNGMTSAQPESEKPKAAPNPRDTIITHRTASIPASPLSVQSLEVLSCSVPFLRNMILRPSARSREKTEKPSTPATPQSRIAKAVRPTYQHKRSGSFSDALRDKRTPLSSPKADNIELKDLPSFAITGGLVRGILLQPSPAKVDSNIPVTPGPEMNEPRYAGTEGYLGERHHHIGVKKFVGEVRRALSSRKTSSSTSPARTLHSAGSSTSRGGSRGSDRSQRLEPKPQPDWQQLGGPPRVDVLGKKIETSYKGAREETRLSKIVSVPNPASAQPKRRSDIPQSFQTGKVIPRKMHESYEAKDFARMNSHVTTGSRSIVIVDATGAPELPAMPTNLPSLSSMSTEMTPIPLFRSRDDLGLGVDLGPPRETAHSMHIGHWRSSDAQLHDLLSGPHRWSAIEDSMSSPGSGLPRKSSSVHASAWHPSALHMPALPQQLRRQPGGKDLREADHGQRRDTRPHSLGTISPALTSSIIVMKGEGDARMPFVDPRNERSVSLLQTHSSQPILRASFEEEARRLKGIPDEETTGGIEDALLKLEGKIPSPSFSTFSAEMGFEDPANEKHASGPPPILKEAPSQDSPYANIMLEGSTPVLENLASPMTETQGASIFRVSGSAVPSMDSRMPYLTPHAAGGKRLTASSSELSLAVPARSSQRPHYDRYSATSTPDSFSFVQQPASAVDDGSMSHYPSFRAGPWSGYGTGAFLLDDSETLSDISTEIASHHPDSGVRTFYYDDAANDETRENGTLQQQNTPPSTAGADAQSPDRRQLLPRIPMRRPNQTLKEKISQPKLQEQYANQPFPVREGSESRQRGRTSSEEVESGTHMPFVLAFESEVIAEQLTIIEKDALDEVDWKDLISLNWQQSPSHARNWVDYLNKEKANGVDIVIARFNLVVKWCVSEVVLTDLPSERARTITKYIHIASHCHRLHNFASLYQITLALLSSDLARLTKTWSLVALREKQMLEHLEQLCRPLRNFHNLRAEMESAMPGNGIIPFIGLYTHDLMFNALKSARINSPSPGKQPLINFERFQTAASIVKNLLRLTEASSRYTFHPDPEALSRCLWIAALEDADIEARSIALESA